MDQMQATKKKGRILHQKRDRGLCQYALSGLGGLILGGGTFMGQALPLGACLISAQPPGGRALGATIGAVLGYFIRCEPAEAVEYTAVSLLMLLTIFLFRGTSLPTYGWFMPLSCFVICGVMGAVGIWGSVEPQILPWLGKATMGAVGTFVFRKAMAGHRGGWVILAGAMVFSLSGVGRYIDLGLLGAVTIASVTGELLPGAVMGIALDLAGGGELPMTLVMVVPGILCKLLSVKRAWLRGLLYGILPVATLVLSGEWDGATISAIAAGAVLGYVLGLSPILTPEVTATEDHNGGKRREMAASVLDALGMELPNPPQGNGCEAERIFDAVGERVCKKCPLFRR